MKLAANIGLLFADRPPLERIAAAAAAGFEGVELLFPYDLDARLVIQHARAHHLPVVQLNSPPGDRAAGELGFAAVPGLTREFQASIHSAIEFAQICECSQIHVLAGVPPIGVEEEMVFGTYVSNLLWAAEVTAACGMRIMIEPLNDRDAPGYALSTMAQAARVLANVAQPNVGLQFDLYHCQIMGGDLTHRLRQFAPLIQHVQISGAPLRNEPDRGEVNLAHVMRTLAENGYDGWVSAEYRPSGRTEESLQWMSIVRDAFTRIPA